MTYYNKEISRIRGEIYRNKGQLDAVIAVKRYIDSNYSGKIDLDLLSAVRFVSKFHLLRVFRRYYGVSPKQYLISRRMTASRELLKAEMPVTQVCFAVGFESPASFSTLFKSRTGLSPQQYQKAQLLKSFPAR